MFLRVALPLILMLFASVVPPQVPPATEHQIDALIEANKTSEAVTQLQNTLRSNPDWQPGLWRLGSLFYGADRFIAAREAFTKLSGLDPKQGAPWALLGLSDFGLQDYNAASEHIQRGLTLGFPAELNLSETCYVQLSFALIATGRFDRALTVLAGIAGHSKTPELLEQAAALAALRIAAQPDDVMRLVSPEKRAVLEELGRLELGVARSEISDANPRWLKLVDANPDLPGLHAAYGKYLLISGDASAAEPQFRAELARTPSDVNSLLGLGFVLMETGRLDEATTISQQALHLDPNSANGHQLLGQLYSRRGDYEKARVELEASRDLDPNLSRVHYALAQIYLKLHKPEQAAREAAAYKAMQVAEESFRQTGRLAGEKAGK